jgi:2-(acetamidomethylene)succinate hydrolase
VNPVLFLHGLTAVADVWGPTIEALGPGRPDCYAIDQRGHGQSHVTGGYGIGTYLRDTAETIAALGLESAHIVGHSMGARVALVFAARRPELTRSVAIVDIGPEEWRENWTSTWESVDRMPDRFSGPDEALAFAGSRTQSSPIGTGMFLARLKDDGGGGLTWRADREAIKATVKSQRSRNFWADWRAIAVPALLVRGGTSREVRPQVFERMAASNPKVKVREIPDVSHNIPLIAPDKLASELNSFWSEVSTFA